MKNFITNVFGFLRALLFLIFQLGYGLWKEKKVETLVVLLVIAVTLIILLQ